MLDYPLIDVLLMIFFLCFSYEILISWSPRKRNANAQHNFPNPAITAGIKLEHFNEA